MSERPATPAATLEYFVSEMDCAECARTVRGAIGNVAGASDVSVNFTTQTLRLTLDEARTPRAALERDLARLGYPPRLKGGEVLADAPGGAVAGGAYGGPETPPAWYRTAKGRFVIVTGALLVVSALLALTFPSLAPWGFTAATLIGVAPLARKAWASARLGRPFTINTLISLAALGAVAIGEAPEGAIVVFLFAIGELLETVAAGRARASIHALAALAPKVALLLEGGRAREVPVAALAVGDLVHVQPGGRVPADGTIVEGSAGIDEAPVTGESMPVAKAPGDALFAGSIATDAVLTVRVDRPASDSTIARIIHLVEEAESSKAPVARFIDRFSSVYTPAAMLAALLVAVVPPLLFGADWGEWVYRALALLLIACPCALVLSVPAAVTSGISAGARRGLLIKGGAVLEAIGDVKTVAFDKTGTLTENRPQVTDVVPLAASEDEVLRLAAAVETGSAHPLAKAILKRAEALDVPVAVDERAVPGQAVTASVAGKAYAVGSPRYAAERAPLPPAAEAQAVRLEDEGKTVVVLLQGHTPLGLIAIRDEPRADAAEAVKRLTRLGVRSVMLTGDNARTGQAIADHLGLEARSELLPEDKLAAIDDLKRDGKVVMVGDGINDGPVLARADASVAMGQGALVARAQADLVVVSNRLSDITVARATAQQALRIVHQNLAWAAVYNAACIPAALLGWLPPWAAGLGMACSSLAVVLNALRASQPPVQRLTRG